MIIAANDVAKFADGFNYHSYWPLASYRANFGALRKYLESEGAGERAVWLTELGTNLEGPSALTGSGMATRDAGPTPSSDWPKGRAWQARVPWSSK